MTKKLIGFVKPKKPVSEMTEAERAELVDQLFDRIKSKVAKKAS